MDEPAIAQHPIVFVRHIGPGEGFAADRGRLERRWESLEHRAGWFEVIDFDTWEGSARICRYVRAGLLIAQPPLPVDPGSLSSRQLLSISLSDVHQWRVPSLRALRAR